MEDNELHQRIAELENELAKWVQFWRDKDNATLQARIAELEAALKPFANKNLSDEITTTTLEYLSPLNANMKEIQKMKESDDNIRAARKALEKCND